MLQNGWTLESGFLQNGPGFWWYLGLEASPFIVEISTGSHIAWMYILYVHSIWLWPCLGSLTFHACFCLWGWSSGSQIIAIRKALEGQWSSKSVCLAQPIQTGNIGQHRATSGRTALGWLMLDEDNVGSRECLKTLQISRSQRASCTEKTRTSIMIFSWGGDGTKWPHTKAEKNNWNTFLLFLN